LSTFDFSWFYCYYAHVVQYKYLESRPDRASGELTIKGTRIRIAQVINMLANGSSLEQLHKGWPWISVATLRGAVAEATQLLSTAVHA
jgi:uncharacterized protein (DUF433 family)